LLESVPLGMTTWIYLRNAAKCKFVVSKIPEPSARRRVMNVLVRDQSYPEVNVR